MKVRIQDIAKRSGVAISTVSRVINNSGYVSEETRRKVEAVIQEFNYKPATVKNHLRESQLPYVGIMVKGIGNPFFQKMTRELERGLLRQGYAASFHDVLHQDEIEYTRQAIRSGKLRGAILMGGSSTYTEEQIRACEAPLVLLTIRAQADVPKGLYSSVTVDDVAEGRKATRALIDMGHEHIGFIYTDPHTPETPNQQRFVGYRQALEEAGIAYDADLVAGASDSTADLAMEVNGYRLGYRMMQRLLQVAPQMTAVFAYSDTLAIGAAKGALVAGRRIPEDLSIIGFDGVDETEFYHPAIDTIYQPTSEMVEAAVRSLVAMIDGEEARHLIYPGTLMRRGSTQGVR